MIVPPEEIEEELRHRYLLLGIATGPAKPADIDKLEQSLEVSLPLSYRAYLRVCGTHPPRSLVGSDCTMSQLLDINEWATELVEENNVKSKFPEEMFVFLMHQGYTFLYFPLDGSDDPPVYCYLEGEAEPKLMEERFSFWVGSVS